MTDEKTPEDAPAEEASTEPSGPAGNRWWIAIIAVGALIVAGAVLFGGFLDPEESTSSPEPTLIVSPSPGSSEEATTEPTPEPEPCLLYTSPSPRDED